jgi:hypothetical protein
MKIPEIPLKWDTRSERGTEMAWVPIAGAIDRLRVEKGLTIVKLARAARLDPKTVRAFISGTRDAQDGTAEALARALGCDVKAIANEATETVSAYSLTPPPPHSPSEHMVPTAPDTKQAQRETTLGLDKPWIEISGRRYQVLSFTRTKKIEFSHDCMRDDEYAVCGRVRHFEPIPADAAAVLEAEVGRGAAYFRIRREVPGLGPQGGSEFLHTTVFAPSGKRPCAAGLLSEQDRRLRDRPHRHRRSRRSLDRLSVLRPQQAQRPLGPGLQGCPAGAGGHSLSLVWLTGSWIVQGRHWTI